jgi:hypothetical protein
MTSKKAIDIVLLVEVSTTGSCDSGVSLIYYVGINIYVGIVVVNRWDEKAGLRRDAVGSQVIDALESARDKGDRQ